MTGPLPTHPHRRYNPLTDEWVLVSAGRTSRPWLGSREGTPTADLPAYDPTCYLCPGNTRASGERNPQYTGTFVFTNDFAALSPESQVNRVEHGLFQLEGERGTSRVLCFSPRHDLALARMPIEGVRRVIDMWAEQTAELGRDARWVQVFENRGEEMGASNPHPHGQVWAGSSLPNEAVREDRAQRRHYRDTGERLLADYASQELDGQRVVDQSEDWLVVVPFWAVWPFETLVVPHRAAARLPELDERSRDALAMTLARLLSRYDNLFERPFPFSMGWHQAPFDDGSTDHWQLHAHFYPCLLGPRMRKFMVGYELLAEPQRDITPEDAAERLRQASPEPVVETATKAAANKPRPAGAEVG
jgi:UDPglucose--hexose-1-phosphate uridylyltransferase